MKPIKKKTMQMCVYINHKHSKKIINHLNDKYFPEYIFFLYNIVYTLYICYIPYPDSYLFGFLKSYFVWNLIPLTYVSRHLNNLQIEQ